MNDEPENRVDKIVSDLLKGRRLKLRAKDAAEKEAITMAARLVAARQAPQRMSPAFRRRLGQALERKPDQRWVTRRAALVAGLGLAAGAAGGGLLGRALAPEAVKGGGPIEPTNGRWFDVAALSDLVDGHARRVTAGAVGAFVFRHGDGVSAVSSVCSHLPCELWWNGKNSALACPCHPASFAPDGRPIEDYRLAPLNQVHVRVTAAGRVEVWGAA